MSFGPASKENAISRALHSLTLIAGIEANKDNKTRPVDLNVRGGGIFNKNLVVCGNLDVESFINGDLDGNIFTNSIMASNSSEGITVVGNLIIDDDFILTANTIAANTITSANGNDITIEALDTIILNSPTTVITGDLDLGGNILPITANTGCIGSLDKPWGKLYTHDLIATGNIMANIMNMNMTGNLLVGDVFCANIEIQTDRIVPKSGSGAIIQIDGDLNMMGGNIFSVNTIGTHTGLVVGDVTGNLTGNTTGKHTGDVCGDVTGNLTGNTTGTHVGPITGDTTGKHTGDVCGNVDGNLTNVTTITKIGSGNIEVNNNFDMQCNHIANVESLEVNTILSKTGTIAVANTLVMATDKQILFPTSGIEIGYSITASNNTDIAIGSDVGATGDYSIAIGTILNSVASETIAIGTYTTVNAARAIGMGSYTYSEGVDSIAIGFNIRNSSAGAVTIGHNTMATSSSTNAVILGSYANASSAESSVAIGAYTNADNKNAVAIGLNSTVTGNGAISLGMHAESSDLYSVAIGGGDSATFGAVASGPYTIAIGSGNPTDSEPGAKASGVGAIAIGGAWSSIGPGGYAGAVSSGSGSIAIGANSDASDERTIAMGFNASANITGASAFGAYASASGQNSSALGPQTNASGYASISVGVDSTASGARGISMASGSIASAADTIAIGSVTDATVAYAIAIGKYAQSTAIHAIAIGSGVGPGDTDSANATGDNSVALGRNTLASTTDTVAIGHGSEATSTSGVAIGDGANAAHIDSIAIGTGATTSTQDDIRIGNSTPTSATATATAFGQIFQDRVWSDATIQPAFINGTGDIMKGGMSGNVDWNCANISNVQAIFVDQMFGKNSPINFQDTINISNTPEGGNITFEGGILIGDGSSNVSESTSITIGKGATSGNTNSIVLGSGATETGNASVAIGNSASAGQNGVAIGNGATETGNGSVSIGNSASASQHGISIGNNTTSGIIIPSATEVTSVPVGPFAGNSTGVDGRAISFFVTTSFLLESIRIYSQTAISPLTIELYNGLMTTGGTSVLGPLLNSQSISPNTPSYLINYSLFDITLNGGQYYTVVIQGGITRSVSFTLTQDLVNFPSFQFVTGGTASVLGGTWYIDVISQDNISGNAIAIGANSTVTGEKSVVIGYNSASSIENGIALGNNATVISSSRSLALGIHSDSVITGGSIPFLQCLVNDNEYEIPLTVVTGGGGVDANLIVSNIVCANTRVETDLIVPKTGGNVTLDGNLIITDTLYVGNIAGNSPVTFNDDIIALGDIFGDTTGTHTGDVTGDLIGNSTGTHTGDVTGDLTGNSTGVHTGDVTGDLTGNSTGTHTGDVTGDLTGNSTGVHTGNVTGDLIGNSTGTHTGDLIGNSTGTHTGDLIGNSTGTHTGDVTGDLTGNSTGIHTGNVIADEINVNVKLITDLIEPKTSAGNVYVDGNLVVSETVYVSNIAGGSSVTFDDDIIALGDVDIKGSLILGSPLSETSGGTGQTSFATGDLLYASAANTLSKRAVGTNGHILTLSGGIPVWQAASAASFDPLNPVLIGTGTTGIGAAGSVAIGSTTNSLGANAIEIGNNSNGGGTRSTAIGFNSQASMTDAVAIGDYSNATGYRSVSIGSSTASGTYAVAVGFGSVASSGTSGAIALGSGSIASNRCVVLGSKLTGLPSIYTGVTGGATESVAIGFNSKVTGLASVQKCIVIGSDNNVTATQSTAIGLSNNISHQACFALGVSLTSARNNQCLLNLNARQGIAGEANAIFNSINNELTYDPSSIRFKNIIGDLDDISDKFDQLNPVRFVFKDPDTGNVHPMANEQIGFIAEDMANIFPEFTVYEDNECTIPSGISYPYMTSMLTKQLQTERQTIKTQGNLIVNLSDLVASQGNLIADLQSRVIQLESHH